MQPMNQLKQNMTANDAGAAHAQTMSPPAGAALTTSLSSRKVRLLLLAGITLIAALLRFYKLGAWSFWGDEILSVVNIEDGFNYNLLRQSLGLSLIQVAIGRLGVSEWTARLAPALIGIVSIPILYFPIRKIAGSAAALLTMLFLALSPWHLYWSQNARYYTLLLLFYTLALLTFFVGVEEDRPLYLLLSLLFLGLAARESLLALFLVPILGAYLLLVALLPFQKPPSFRRLPRLALLLLPLLIFAIIFAWPYLRHLPAWFRGFGRVNNSPTWIAAGVIYYVRLAIVCFAAATAVYLLTLKRRDRRARIGLLLGVNAALPVAALMLLSTFHYTANRYAFITLVSWLLLAAIGVVELVRHTTNGKRWLAAGALLLLLLDPLSEAALYYRYQNGNRDDWRTAFAYVQENMAPGDRVVVPHQQLAGYYLRQDTLPFSRFDLSQFDDAQHTTWLIEDLTVVELYPEAYQWLRNEAQLVAMFDVSVQARTFVLRVYRYSPQS